MGANPNLPDSQTMRLTDKGRRFFARTNYSDEHNLRINPHRNQTVNNIINSKGVNIGNNNALTNTSIRKDNRVKWYNNPWVVTIGGALIISVLFLLIKKYCGIDLN